MTCLSFSSLSPYFWTILCPNLCSTPSSVEWNQDFAERSPCSGRSRATSSLGSQASFHSGPSVGRPGPGAWAQGLSGPGLGAQASFPSAVLSVGNCCRQLVSGLNSWTHYWGPASWPGSACQGPAGCHPRRQGGGHLQFQWPPCFWAEKSDRPPNWLGFPPFPSPSQVAKTVRSKPLPITAPWGVPGREETKAVGTYLG